MILEDQNESRVIDTYNHKDITENGAVGTITPKAWNIGHCGSFAVAEPIIAASREQVAGTLCCTDQQGTIEIKQPNFHIRKLTETECMRLMGVKDEDSERVHKHQSKSSMYHLAGDSIVTAVLMAIFGELFGVEWKSKIDTLVEDLAKETKNEY